MCEDNYIMGILLQFQYLLQLMAPCFHGYDHAYPWPRSKSEPSLSDMLQLMCSIVLAT